MQTRPPIEERFPRPSVMGVVNVTPDSFSDGGVNLRPDDAIAAARRMIAEGAAIVDVGGESTRPGSEAVSVDEELRRVLPVLEAIAPELPVSIDTAKAEVARRALELGVELVNDVTALRGDPELAGVVADSGAYLCLMHMRGAPTTSASPSRRSRSRRRSPRRDRRARRARALRLPRRESRGAPRWPALPVRRPPRGRRRGPVGPDRGRRRLPRRRRDRPRGLRGYAVPPARGPRRRRRRHAAGALRGGMGERPRPQARRRASGRALRGNGRAAAVTRAFVGLGANLGDREATLRRAVELLGADPELDVVPLST